MKKICSVLLILTLILSLPACKTPAAEVESGALAETPVEEQESTKEEETPKPLISSDSEGNKLNQNQPLEENNPLVSTPSSNEPEDPQSTESPLPQEPEMENVLEFKIFLYHNGKHPEYDLEDFSGLGIKKVENHTEKTVLSAVFGDVNTAEETIGALLQREDVSRVWFSYTANRVKKGTPVVSSPYIKQEVVDAIQYFTSLYGEVPDDIKEGALLFKGRVSVEFGFDDAAYHHLLTIEDFSEISAESCWLFSKESGEMNGYIDLTDDSEDAIKQAMAFIEKIPGVKSVEHYIEYPDEFDGLDES